MHNTVVFLLRSSEFDFIHFNIRIYGYLEGFYARENLIKIPAAGVEPVRGLAPHNVYSQGHHIGTISALGQNFS